MCGRFTLHSRDRIALKGAQHLDLPFERRYNIAPSQKIMAIADFGRGPEPRELVWGLVPSWSADGTGFINARAETLGEKPSFSESFRFRRCLIRADGFYEWKRIGRESGLITFIGVKTIQLCSPGFGIAGVVTTRQS